MKIAPVKRVISNIFLTSYFYNFYGIDMDKHEMRQKIKYGNAILITIMILIIGAALFAHLVYGITPVIVDGISMKPTLHTGDVAIMYKKPYNNIKIGNVIVYNYYGTLIIHRVIGIYEHNGTECFIIKGDNNPIPDPGYPQYCGYYTINGFTTGGVPYFEIKGVVWTYNGNEPIVIPYIGSFALAIRGTGSDAFLSFGIEI